MRVPQISPLIQSSALFNPLWEMGRVAVCTTVGGASALFLRHCTKLQVDGLDHLHRAIFERPPGTPLITGMISLARHGVPSSGVHRSVTNDGSPLGLGS
jgi:hypothetical protein